ncbi:MAG TPA: metalloregulator ArsR/SmtB family transcription factor [Acidimicrobiales bacterium]|nr:metalloregulator ArsR/SmtB family transcription factor [Acidimicrobiales bacterium]
MPLIHTDLPSTRTPRVTVSASVAIEIEWALASGEREDFRRDHPGLEAVYRGVPDLEERVRSFWGPGEAVSCGGFLELMVLAHHGGLLFSTDADALLDRLDVLGAATSASIGDLPLLSETADDRAAVLLRLARLRESPERRQRYVALVRDMWDAMRPEWELSGRGAVEVAVAARHELQAKGADWHEVVRGECDYGPELERSVAALGPGGEVVVVPAYFTHKGLLVDLPGVVVIGVRTDTTGAHARARTEALARRLKAISDPTRLAILDALRSGPRTVTEIAAAFSLAQPTVSNHVKILRDTGLVADAREGTRRNLIVQNDVVEELITNLHDALSDRTAHAHGGPVSPPEGEVPA